MRFCEAKAGEFIFKQGDPSFSYYIILQGQCKVIIDDDFKKIL
jgi:CRP-like cAMP-binding protein